MPKKKLAEMKTESEEARWFEANQARLLKLFEQAEKEGTLRVGGRELPAIVARQALASARTCQRGGKFQNRR